MTNYLAIMAKYGQIIGNQICRQILTKDPRGALSAKGRIVRVVLSQALWYHNSAEYCYSN